MAQTALEGSPYAGWVAAKGWNERIWIQPPQLRANLEFEVALEVEIAYVELKRYAKWLQMGETKRQRDDSIHPHSSENVELSEQQNVGKGNDIISSLPENVLHHILSFLSTKDAIRSSVLSTKWKYLWTSIANIDLKETYHLAREKEDGSFLDFVERVLLLHDASDIKIEASICVYEDLPEQDVTPRVLGLLTGISNIKKLTVTSQTLEYLTPIANLLDRLPVFYNMTHLVLHSELFGDSFGVMIDLLENSPKLESLNFEEGFNPFVEDDWMLGRVPSCFASSLKTVRIADFNKRPVEMHFIRLLLKNATVLERLTLRSYAQDLKQQQQKFPCNLKTVPENEFTSRVSWFPKNWGRLLPPPPIPIHEDDNVEKLPWLLNYHWNDDGFLLDEPMVLVCKLFDPSHHKQPYSVDQVIGQDNRGRYQIITLPDLNRGIQADCPVQVATFSSDPCSPDCVFFVVRDYYYWRTISTCRPRDMSWTTQAFERQPYDLQGVVFAGGFLYCLFYGNGDLATFSVANREWSVICTNSNLRFLRGSYHLFVCNGQLLFANLDNPILRGNDNGQCHLFRFSRSRRPWVTETSCRGNQALFLGCTSSSCVSASGETTNKVYYHAFDGTLRFYYMEDGTNRALEGSPYAGWVAAKGRNEWIQPPQLRKNLEFEG
ncbi:hypothetical protein RHSIM_RhsimUnG0013000 [Rhododendron simsii]|uniref:F-box domain-containing protein n=1 Tax=Rhododendron simsii TaxID=118357 RepID=A0A834L5R5_RHOSS|nr:hypothetical protein RHSIM_RhsimUnG0013000 [Rhododendron simsii]